MSFLKDKKAKGKLATDKFGITNEMVSFKNNCNTGKFLVVGSVRSLGRTMKIQPLMHYHLGNQILFPFDSSNPRSNDWTLLIFLTEFNEQTVLGSMLIKSYNQGNFNQLIEKIEVATKDKFDLGDVMLTMKMVENPKAKDKWQIKFTFGKDGDGELSDGFDSKNELERDFTPDLLANYDCKQCVETETGEVFEYENIYKRNEAFALERNLNFLPISVIEQISLWRNYKGNQDALKAKRLNNGMAWLEELCDIALEFEFIDNDTAKRIVTSRMQKLTLPQVK